MNSEELAALSLAAFDHIVAATPGFRWLELHPDGGIDTGIERIAAYPDPLDLSGAGY